MKMIFCLLFTFSGLILLAAPGQTTYHIKIDQFGYLPNSKKVAVITDPQTGYNAAESFNASTGANQYQVRRWDTDAVVFSGTISTWNGGATHAQSGDRGWHFDFSSVTAVGSYYIFDVGNNIGSFRFDINNTVYDDVLKQAIRTFFYQRINFAKQTPFADVKWADGACFEGIGQDQSATNRYTKSDVTTAKDLRGGWMDAGDKNKYTTFANTAVIALMEAYRMNPNVFKDNYNIPESGNGIPDLVDEVKYELDFLKRMQDGTGTNGFLLKLGFDNYNDVIPPSTDTRPRYYLPECTSATISGMSMFAVAANAIKNIPALTTYAQDLITRAEAAWVRAKSTTTNFSVYQTACDDGDIKSGDADNTAEDQLGLAVVAAVYLYEATGKAEYKTFAEANYTNINPYKINWWGPYWLPQQLALLRMTTLSGISVTVANNIRNQKAGMNYLYSLDQYNANTDLYRAHLNNETYHWGHNQVRTTAGNQNLDYVQFNLNSSNHTKYREIAEQYLHWMHGVNPLGMVMLSNMYNHGAEKSVNEIYHSWFTDGSQWDNALTSTFGPPPGYVPGGPNTSYSGSITGITNQPPQKAYKDWNGNWPENSWEITENSIYCQSTYIMLLSRLMTGGTTPIDNTPPSAPTNLIASNITANSVSLTWTASTDDIGVTAYEVYQGATLLNSNVGATTYSVSGLTCNTSYNFSVKSKDAAGNVSSVSNTAVVTTLPCAMTINKTIYDESLNSEWTDVSTASSRIFNNTGTVQSGLQSIRVSYSANGTLAFSRTTALPTTSTTQLRFWVYNNGFNGIRIYTQSADGTGNSTTVSTRTSRRRWVEVVVSMSQLGHPALIKRIIIQNNSSTSTLMYFDNVRLMNVTSGQNVSAPPLSWVQINKPNPELTLYPNPAMDQTNLSFYNPSSSSGHIEVLDYTGRVFRTARTHFNKGRINHQMDLQSLPSGNYIIRVSTGHELFMNKLIKVENRSF